MLLQQNDIIEILVKKFNNEGEKLMRKVSRDDVFDVFTIVLLVSIVCLVGCKFCDRFNS